MDPTAFPGAAAYLAALAGGLDAHPQCLVKGSVVREIVTSGFAREVSHLLPAELRSHFDVKPVATSWVPEVHVHALLLATYDRFFAGPRGKGKAGFLDWAYTQNLALFDTTLYRVLFFVVSPERLFNGMDKRWSTFRRGSTLEATLVEKGRAEMTVRYPVGLYNDLLAGVRAASFRAAATCAGARDAHVDFRSARAGETSFTMTWR